jgi:hypothetical protein
LKSSELLQDKYLNYILSPNAVREQSQRIYQYALSGKSHFILYESKLNEVADFVIEVIKESYPNNDVPFHSRWRHFTPGNHDRVKENPAAFSSDKLEACRQKIELAIVSVLLDAGAGEEWKYLDPADGKLYSRSEGLGIASFYMYVNKLFTLGKGSLPVVDAQGLLNLSEARLGEAFQVREGNSMNGLTGRCQLLQKLGEVLSSSPEVFGKNARLGNLVDYWLENLGKEIELSRILQEILIWLSPIWDKRQTYKNFNLGDTWDHPALPKDNKLIPFHKLSQWLTYSLVEPLQEGGFKIKGIDGLTGLPEYRNGGLFVDLGVFEVKDKELLKLAHQPGSELIIEWRALTIIFLDKLADVIRLKLRKTETELPLLKILEGGTWKSGRVAAKLKRADASPPIKIKSDGTVF